VSNSSGKLSRRALLKWSVAGVLATAGSGVAASKLQVVTRTLQLPGWRADGFRVAQVSDVHLNHDGLLKVAQHAVRLAVEAKPDLFVFTGDFLNFDHDDCFARIESAFEDLQQLACPCLAILGNHDYKCGVVSKVADSVRKTRLQLLVNQAVRVGDVTVLGLDDALHGEPDYALATAQGNPSTLVLLHEPDAADNVAQGAALVLSGHSHGGEVCLPLGRPLYTPRGSRRYTAGFYPEAPTPVYVNRGTATLGPARVFCPPEVSILTLSGVQ